MDCVELESGCRQPLLQVRDGGQAVIVEMRAGGEHIDGRESVRRHRLDTEGPKQERQDKRRGRIAVVDDEPEAAERPRCERPSVAGASTHLATISA